MLTVENYMIKKLKKLLFRAVTRFENNNNSKFESNGEAFFIEELFRNFMKVSGEKVVFDVGANTGDYAQILIDQARKYKIKLELHLFEPQESCYKLLCDRFDINHFKINQFGVSNKEEMVKIYYDKQNSRLASLYQRNLTSFDIHLDKTELIQLKKLETYILEDNITHVHFMKIDIEGHELSAFKGLGEYCNGDFIDFIQFEYGGANLDSHISLLEIYTYLEEREFILAKIMRKGLLVRKYTPEMDNFQYSNYVAISKRVYETLKVANV